jgi:hypothetical protein
MGDERKKARTRRALGVVGYQVYTEAVLSLGGELLRRGALRPGSTCP